MGEVFAAEDTKLGRKVALKVLPPEMASPERRERFEREAKSVAALNHPNIVQVFSVEEADGIHFIVMELVRGKTLTELLSRHGMPLSKFFEIAIPLADAVAAAHRADITHRNLKPDNVMLGDDGRIKVLISGWLSRCRGLWMSAARFRRRRRLGKGLLLGRLLICLRSRRKGRRLTRGRIFVSLGIIF